MRDLNDLYYFVEAVEHGGFAPAGRALNLPKSLLSRRVAQLEARLGVRLIQRSTRHFALTEIGEVYFDHCKAMLIEADAAQEAIDRLQAEPRGTVRLSCPVALLQVHVSRMLDRFMAQHPQVTIVVDATNRRVDVLGERIDIAIRVRPPPIEDSEAVMRVLADRGQCLVASPALLADRPAPVQPADLAGWPSLGLGNNAQVQRWQLFGPGGQQAVIDHRPRLVTTDMIALRDAALAGLGVLKLPILMVQDELAQGRLVRLLPDWQPQREIIHVVFASRRGLLPAVRLLIDHLAASFQALDED
ncbi:MAG: LysR family transcriptional regulator [Paracoccus sp. (in: a-proteobacteria)]|jgi:DNA-binding transcriptional LysR family regulator